MTGCRRRASPAIPPPDGATLASFVLFVSLAALLAIIYAGSELWHRGFGFPSDEAWVRAVFARNVAARQGLCFNPGTPVAGAEAPAWIASLAVARWLAGSPLLTAKLLGVLCVILTSVVTWYIVLDLLGDWRFAFLGGLLVAANARLTAEGLNGTEGALAALLVAAAIHWQARGWEGTALLRAIGAAAAGLAALCRPELLLLVPILLIDRWLIARTAAPAGQRLRRALAGSLPEAMVMALVLAPYVIHNWRVGGPLWQQPMRAPSAHLAWAGALLGGLWADNPLLLCAAAVGLPVALLAPARPQARHRSFALMLVSAVMVLVPGLIWSHARAQNTAYAIAYMTPVTVALAMSGLFLVHRGAKSMKRPKSDLVRRITLGAAIALTCAALLGFTSLAHLTWWQQHGLRVQRVNDMEVQLGQWADAHVAPDASIASQEIGAIGFFSHRRMVDLGGTISQEGLAFLSRPGSADENLLAYLEKAQPSYLVIRPADFPNLSQRTELLTPAITCATTGGAGVITMTLYETPWPPPSVREATGQAEE